MISPEDVEAIERLTAMAVGVHRGQRIGDWLLSMDAGPIQRARSAAALRHEIALDEAQLSEIEAAYRKLDMTPSFRLAEVEGLEAVKESLLRRGYVATDPTLLMVGKPTDLRALNFAPCDLADRPDAGWTAAFTGEGFDPADSAIRAAALARAENAMFGAVREGGVVTAVGAVAFGHGWASINGMRTVRSFRGRGMAGRVLTGLAVAAQARGLERIFLQVEEPNVTARALYERADFQTAWRYSYFSWPSAATG